jgi:hypothetical protein
VKKLFPDWGHVNIVTRDKWGGWVESRAGAAIANKTVLDNVTMVRSGVTSPNAPFLYLYRLSVERLLRKIWRFLDGFRRIHALNRPKPESTVSPISIPVTITTQKSLRGSGTERISLGCDI